MSTNDPLDPYPGNLRLFDVKKGPIAPLQILPLGTIMTNDPAGEYKREPLLSDEQIFIRAKATDSIRKDNIGATVRQLIAAGMEHVRAYYEDKITKGELMVVRTCQLLSNDYDCYLTCTNCHDGVEYYNWEELPDTMRLHCPGYGARIIEKP